MEAFPTTPQAAETDCWTEADDRLLRSAVDRLGKGHWQRVALTLSGRSPVQCHRRWRLISHRQFQERTWTDTEDQLLRAWTSVKGPTNWTGCAALLDGRSARQCRRRWITHLAAEGIEWTQRENDRVLADFHQFGPNWPLIAMRIGNRSESSVRNHFYSDLQPHPAEQPISPASDKPASETMTREEAEMQVTQLLRHMRGLEAMLVDAKLQAKLLEESMEEDEKGGKR